jgi:serine/threonine protein kinase
MNEPSTSAEQPAAQVRPSLQSQIDALQSGAWTETEFIHKALLLPESVWATLALVDQRYRRGLLPEAIFRSIKSKLARGALEQSEYARTVELSPPLNVIAPTSTFMTAATPANSSTGESADCRRTVDEATGVAPATDAPPQEPAASSVASTSPDQDPQSATRKPDCLLGDRYMLESVLGRGGMGTVYKASDRHRADLPEGSRHVALKMLNAHIKARSGALGDLRREFYCAQALSHPNIVKVYELHCEGDPPFYTMELLEGRLLSDLLERQHPRRLERQYAFAIIRDVGAALVHAHSRSVVHGDLKPHNIIITDTHEVRILDFGASGAVTRQWPISDALQRNRASAFTLSYTCCELLDGLQTDPRDDLYALACLSYEMLAGEHPFNRRPATEARDLGMRPARPPGLTDRQWHALQIGLSWRRDARSASVRDWLRILGLEPPTEQLPPLPAPGPESASIGARSWKPNSTQAAVAALVVVLIAGLSTWTADHAKRGKPIVGNLVTHEALASPAGTSAAPFDAPSLAKTGPASVAVNVGNEVDLAPPSTDSTRSETPESPAVDSAVRSSKVGDPQAPPDNKITLTANTYRVPSGETFAEIMVWRSNGSHTDGSFVWWTEPASANPGRDFVAQGRTRHLFLNGRHLAKLYIRIIPNQARIHPEKFYVDIGEPGAGYSLGAVTRAAIVIPPILTARNVDGPIPASQQHN